MTPNKTPGTPRRNDRSRRAILDAARELVAEKGYAKLTIEAIAARAGVGKQTIYRWWPSKGAVLLDSVLALSQNGEGEGAEQAITLPDTGDVEADLKALMRATAAEFSDPSFEAPIRALNSEIANDPDLAAVYAEQVAAPVEEAKRERLRSARRAGQIAADTDLDLFLDMLYSPLYQRWLLRSGELTPQYTDRLVEAVLRAFPPAK
ncbi:TetR/AcrR family transcriptional regulator [Actinorugispora endophytica]|uniref:TetR/AcrR family transcriptional regulator n=1 Tax=Actinorugispora endophytica TaxID=1605990 RepID=UPI001FB84C12|nr:TetR/AcrR family transcriptional regulator [Actinorugispora endophytica]